MDLLRDQITHCTDAGVYGPDSYDLSGPSPWPVKSLCDGRLEEAPLCQSDAL